MLLVTSLATFLLTLAISVSPSVDEVRADSELRLRTEYLDRRQMQYSVRIRRRATPHQPPHALDVAALLVHLADHQLVAVGVAFEGLAAAQT